MPRGAKCRFVGFYPPFVDYRPEGISVDEQQAVIIKIEEIEAIRLKDYLKLEQEDCAARMQISRSTFQRILTEARSKIADALLNGKSIRIEGGDYCLGSGYCWRYDRHLKDQDDCSMKPFFEQLDSLTMAEVMVLKNIIAICSTGAEQDSMVDERFGRCPYVQLWDEENGFQQSLDNDNRDQGHGAGIGTAQIILQQRAGVIITNRIGPKGFAVLKKAGVELYECSGQVTVEEALQLYKAKKLKKLEAANN